MLYRNCIPCKAARWHSLREECIVIGRLPTLTDKAAAASDHANAEIPSGTLLDNTSNLMHDAPGTAVLVPVV